MTYGQTFIKKSKKQTIKKEKKKSKFCIGQKFPELKKLHVGLCYGADKLKTRITYRKK